MHSSFILRSWLCGSNKLILASFFETRTYLSIGSTRIYPAGCWHKRQRQIKVQVGMSMSSRWVCIRQQFGGRSGRSHPTIGNFPHPTNMKNIEFRIYKACQLFGTHHLHPKCPRTLLWWIQDYASCPWHLASMAFITT